MPLFREFLLFITYPYTAGIIAVIWLGSAVLIILQPLPLVWVLAANFLATIIIAFFGLRGKQES